MAEAGTHSAGTNKAISGVEGGRRMAPVDHARASVGLAEFSLSASNEVYAQRFINGDDKSPSRRLISIRLFRRLAGTRRSSPFALTVDSNHKFVRLFCRDSGTC